MEITERGGLPGLEFKRYERNRVFNAKAETAALTQLRLPLLVRRKSS